MPNQPPYYRVIIENAAGDYVEMHDFTSLKYSYSLNNAGYAELTLPLKSAKVNSLTVAPLQSWLRVYRWSDRDDPSSERLVWYGLLFDPSYSTDSLTGDITLRYKDLAGILAHRFVPRTYSVTSLTDASQILWNIINASQLETGGDLDIVQGAAPVSKDRQPEKDLQNRSILDVLIAFSEYEDGIDWEITPTPRNASIGNFNTYYTSASQPYHKGYEVGTPLTYFVDDTNAMAFNNIASVTIDEVGSEYANDILALGATIEDVQLFSTAENAPQKTIYGLFENVVSETNVSEQSTLDDKASEELSASETVPFNIVLTMLPLQKPVFGTFDVGDIFTFRFKFYTLRDFERPYRLYRFTMNVDDMGVETTTMELNNI